MKSLTATVLPVFLFVLLAGSLAICQDDTAEGAIEEVPDGFALLDAQKPAAALSAFVAALAADQDSVPLLVGAGRAAIELGEFSTAIQHLTRAASLDPESYDAVLFRARAFAAQGREFFYGGEVNDGGMMLEDAANLLLAAAGLDDTAAEPLLDRAYILMELGDTEGADEAALEAMKREPSNIRALLLHGDAAFIRFQDSAASGKSAGEVKEMWNEALAIYEKAKSSAPEETGPYLGLAALYEADKKWDEASNAVMNALVLDPELLQGYNSLLRLFGDAEGREKLVALLEKLLVEIEKKYPNDLTRKATTSYYAGYAHFLNFDYEASITAYTAALEGNEEYRIGATYYLGRCRFALNEYKKASRDFFRIMAADPDAFIYYLSNDPSWMEVCSALSYLSNFSYEANNLKMARDLIGGILMVVKNNSTYYNNYAFLCRETGEYELAYGAYQECLTLEPSNPAILNDTALILQYHLHRDLDYAKELYNRAIVEAGKIINDDSSNAAAKDDARIALRDATTNLKKMGRDSKRERRG